MKWYEHDSQRFEKEVNCLSHKGLRVSITNEGYGDVYAVMNSQEEQIDILIHYPDHYPKDPPRYYLEGAEHVPTLPDGAVDLKALGIEWNDDMTALEPLQCILKYKPGKKKQDGEIVGLRNLTKFLGQSGDIGFGGREKELNTLKECLIRQENAGCVLVGKPGVGKTALAYKFIQVSCTDIVPPMLKSMTFYEMRLEDILASSKFVGDIERAIKRLLDMPGILALFIDEIHRFSSPQFSQVADTIKPEMASGKLRIIGASTYDEWRQVQDGALKRRLLVIDVPEPTPEETFLMIKPKVSKLNQHYGMQFTDDALRAAIGLGQIYISDLAFPAKAIDILDRAAASQIVQRYENKTIQI